MNRTDAVGFGLLGALGVALLAQLVHDAWLDAEEAERDKTRVRWTDAARWER